MPKTTDIDWSLARTLFDQGLALSEIARRLNCSAGTIRSRAHREKWAAVAAKAQEVLHTEPFNPVERGRKWRERIMAVMETKLDHLASIPPEKLSIRDLKTVVETEELADRVARRSLGLDQPGAGTFQVGLRLDVNVMPIDLEAEERRALPAEPNCLPAVTPSP